MTISLSEVRGLRAIYEHMDPRPPSIESHASMRDLWLRHRHIHPSGNPMSMKALARRWNPAHGARAYRLLTWNTYLMSVRMDVWAVLDEILPGGNWFGSIVGAIVGALTPLTPVGGALLGMKVDAAREALDRLETPLSDITVSKPLVVERASLIGQRLRTDKYDVAALQEVWNAAPDRMLLDALLRTGGVDTDSVRSLWKADTDARRPGLGIAVGLAGPVASAAVGATATSGIDAGSGLMTLGLTLPIREQAFHEFPSLPMFRGKANQDSDFYASKGVLLTRLDLGVGELDLYSTHLHYGGGLPSTPLTSAPTSEERRAVRRSQLLDLMSFVAHTHRQQNVAMIVGDFNIHRSLPESNPGHHAGAIESTCQSYDDIAELVVGRGFTDQYLNQHLHYVPAVSELEGATAFDLDGDDLPIGKRPNYRVDYVFVEEPNREHNYHLDVTNIVPQLFRADVRSSDGGTRMSTLSDHLGLAFNIVVSPR